ARAADGAMETLAGAARGRAVRAAARAGDAPRHAAARPEGRAGEAGMKRAALALLVAGLFAAAWFGRERLLASDAPPRFQGYVEGEFVKVGPTNAGRLIALHVARGDFVAAGAPLFEQDDGGLAAERDAAA